MHGHEDFSALAVDDDDSAYRDGSATAEHVARRRAAAIIARCPLMWRRAIGLCAGSAALVSCLWLLTWQPAASGGREYSTILRNGLKGGDADAGAWAG